VQNVLAFVGRGEDWAMVFVILILVVILPLLILRWVRRWMERSIKARQDLARGVADIADRMGRLESKIGDPQTPTSSQQKGG
jgi:hypothetical protein